MNNLTPQSFLAEEDLCGHHVSSWTKKLWATEIDCLVELKRICSKYHIQYYAGGGTLLGAVRHKGFIPWDDDIDVFMFYNDYKRFCEVAPKEVRAPFFFQNFQTETGFGPGLSRIRNSQTTGCTLYDRLMYDGKYNCGIFIDIFPLFGVEDNSILRFRQKSLIKFWGSLIAGYEGYRNAIINGWTIKRRLNPYILWWRLCRLFTTHKKISELYLKACAANEMTSKVGLLSFSGFNKRFIWERKWFNKTVLLPFEFTDIACPLDYDPILKTMYGDYMEFVKGGQIHTLVQCDPDTPFGEVLKSGLN